MGGIWLLVLDCGSGREKLPWGDAGGNAGGDAGVDSGVEYPPGLASWGCGKVAELDALELWVTGNWVTGNWVTGNGVQAFWVSGRLSGCGTWKGRETTGTITGAVIQWCSHQAICNLVIDPSKSWWMWGWMWMDGNLPECEEIHGNPATKSTHTSMSVNPHIDRIVYTPQRTSSLP